MWTRWDALFRAEKDKKKLSTASWDIDMPEAGEFAIYISYKSLPNSASDVNYTVNSLAGRCNLYLGEIGIEQWQPDRH